MAQAMASFVGVGLSQSMRSRRSMIERHLQRVNPALKGFALRRAVQSSFDSYARYWVESFKVPSLSKQAVARAFSTQGFDEHVGGALEQGKGAILALPHLGGWEWAGRWLADQGHTVTVVVEPLDNQEVFDWFVDLRSKLGMHVVPLGSGRGGGDRPCTEGERDRLPAVRPGHLTQWHRGRVLRRAHHAARGSGDDGAADRRRAPPHGDVLHRATTTVITRSCGRRSRPNGAARSARTSPASRSTSPASSSSSSAGLPSNGTCSSRTGHPTPDTSTDLADPGVNQPVGGYTAGNAEIGESVTSMFFAAETTADNFVSFDVPMWVWVALRRRS